MLASSFTILTTSAPLSLDHGAHALLPALVAYTLRGTCVLLVAWVIATALRRSAAAARYAVWAAAVTTVAVLPLLSGAAPPIDIPVRALPSVSPPSVSPPRERPVTQTIGPADVPSSTSRVTATGQAALRTSVRTVPASNERTPSAIDLPLLIVAIWALGTIGLVVRSIVGTMVMWRRALAAESVSETGWVMLARDVARELGIRRPVTLLMTSIPTVPVTWGVIYPVVLLPAEATGWRPARRRSVLLHELAHVARFDAATQLLGQLVLAVTWVNPLTWLAVHRMRTERERACDDVVLSRGTQPSAYATDLLTIVRTLQSAGDPGFAALAMARHAELERRLRFILDGHRRRETPSPRRSMLSLVAAAPFIVLVAAIHPSAPPLRPVPAAGPVPIARSLAREVAAPPPRAQSVSDQAAHLTRVAATSPLAPPPPFRAMSEGPISVPLSATASARPTPSQSAAAPTRCPVQTEFATGGVSADRGQVAAMELENDDHRVLVSAADDRCVTGRLDGWVILADDESDVTGLGTGAHMTIVDSIDGHVRRAEVSRVTRVSVAADRSAADRSAADRSAAPGEPLYVIDGVIVDGLPVGSPRVSTSSGYPSLGYGIMQLGDSAKVKDSPGYWIAPQNNPDDIESAKAQRATAASVEYLSGALRPGGAGDSAESVDVESNSVGGVIVLQYFADGRARPWTEGSDWFRTTLAALVRETGYNAQQRVATLRTRGGVPAVLDEIRRVRSDMGLRAYFDALLASGDLSIDDVTQAIAAAQSTLTDKLDRDRILSQLDAVRSHPNRSTSVHVF